VHASLAPMALAAPSNTSATPPLLLVLCESHLSALDTNAYAASHHRTLAEARPLRRLAHGDNAKAAARAIKVSAATVHSQLLAIRRKTAQPSLAALLSALLGELARLPPLLVAAAGPDAPR
jgi:DNA-binding CsgD family transcriptional regulator